MWTLQLPIIGGSLTQAHWLGPKVGAATWRCSMADHKHRLCYYYYYYNYYITRRVQTINIFVLWCWHYGFLLLGRVQSSLNYCEPFLWCAEDVEMLFFKLHLWLELKSCQHQIKVNVNGPVLASTDKSRQTTRHVGPCRGLYKTRNQRHFTISEVATNWANGTHSALCGHSLPAL